MKWCKFCVGIVLLPALAAVGWTLGDLTQQGWQGQVWQAPWFWALLGGLSVWITIYLILPRPFWIYVFGHELTHALAVYLTGGKVMAFRVGTTGGHIKTDTVNWWITLSPYFIPLYCLTWLGLWLIVNFYYPLQGFAWILYAGVGLFWGFHLTFTISMIKLGQSDIVSQGRVFSLVVILLINLLLIELFLTGVLANSGPAAARPSLLQAGPSAYSFLLWGQTLWQHFVFCYASTGHLISVATQWTVTRIIQTWKSLTA